MPREKLPAAFARVAKSLARCDVNEIDGLRLDWPDRWLHVRGSNTEPVVRVIAEAPMPRTHGNCAPSPARYEVGMIKLDKPEPRARKPVLRMHVRLAFISAVSRQTRRPGSWDRMR